MGLRGRGETAERTRRNGDVAASDAELDSTKWGYSSAGRAPALQAGGRRFDPDYLHQPLEDGTKCLRLQTFLSGFKSEASASPSERSPMKWVREEKETQ